MRNARFGLIRFFYALAIGFILFGAIGVGTLHADPVSCISVIFENNTGHNANDLHVEFNKPVSAYSWAGSGVDFEGIVPEMPTTYFDMSGGTVIPGFGTHYRFGSLEEDLHVTKADWTFDGQVIGAATVWEQPCP